MPTTGPSQTKQDKGATKIRKGAAPRIQRDNDHDNEHNAATQTESRDRYEREHFHAGDTQDFARDERRPAPRNGDHDRRAERGYSHSDYSHYNDDSRTYQSFTSRGGNRAAGNRYAQYGHNANRRPEDGYGDPMNEVDPRYLGESMPPREYRGHYENNSRRGDRDDLNDRQNGWQANTRVDNRDDDRYYSEARYQNNWRDHQWRETAYRSGYRDWRLNDDWRNEYRNGSEYDRDRGSYGNSRFRDDDYGYGTSGRNDRYYDPQDIRDRDVRNDPRNDSRQPRGFTATSEQDFEDRNPSHERERNRRNRDH